MKVKMTVGFIAPVGAVNDYVLKLKSFLRELDPKVLRALARKLATVLDKRDQTQTVKSIQRLTDEMLPQWLLGIDPKLLLPIARRHGFLPQGKTPAKTAAKAQTGITISAVAADSDL